MRCAFVVRLGQKTSPRAKKFEGWVEEVDSGKELRFHSQDELLAFLAERFLAVSASDNESGSTTNPAKRTTTKVQEQECP